MNAVTVSTAAEKILAFVRRHPGASSGQIGCALRVRRQTRQASMRLLREAGRIFATLQVDRRTLSWTAREPGPAEPVSEPRDDSVKHTVTLSAPIEVFYKPASADADASDAATKPYPESAAPPKPSPLSEDQLDFLHGRGRYAHLDDDDLFIGSPS